LAELRVWNKTGRHAVTAIGVSLTFQLPVKQGKVDQAEFISRGIGSRADIISH
jgi:hypothetical protein